MTGNAAAAGGHGVEAFAGPNADYYEAEFARIQGKTGFVGSWNTMAAVFGPLWGAARGVWGFFWVFLVLELFALVQVGRGLWGELGADQLARYEKLMENIANREAQAAELTAAGDVDGAASKLKIADNRDKLMNFLRMEKWIFDSPDQAGNAFREFLQTFYQDNALVRGTARIGGEQVYLDRLTVPILNVYAAQDHLVPPAASKALQGLVGSSDYQALELPGGHIGTYVGSESRRLLPRTIADWLHRH